MYDPMHCSGIRRARFRDSYDEPSWLEPGQVYRIEFDLNVTSNLFKHVRGWVCIVLKPLCARYRTNVGAHEGERAKKCAEGGRGQRVQMTCCG